MSQEKPATQANPLPQSLESVSANVSKQRALIMLLAGVSGVSLVCALVAISLLIAASTQPDSEPVSQTPEPSVRQLERALSTLGADLQVLSERTDLSAQSLQALSEQLGKLDVNDERNVIIRLQRLLIKQEQDFQQFLTKLEQGMYNFQMMVPHSRGWWEEYKAEMDAVADMSKARENYATTLRDN